MYCTCALQSGLSQNWELHSIPKCIIFPCANWVGGGYLMSKLSRISRQISIISRATPKPILRFDVFNCLCFVWFLSTQTCFYRDIKLPVWFNLFALVLSFRFDVCLQYAYVNMLIILLVILRESKKRNPASMNSISYERIIRKQFSLKLFVGQ